MTSQSSRADLGLFEPGSISDADEKRALDRLDGTLDDRGDARRSALIRKRLRPEGSDAGQKSLAGYKTFLERNAEASCDADLLFTPDDCPALPPLDEIGQRLVPPFADGRLLYRRVWGGAGIVFSEARITETSACIDALSPGLRERAVAGFGIPFMPRLGVLPHHRLRITARLYGFWNWDNLAQWDGPGTRCGFTNRGSVSLVVPGVAGARAEYVLFSAGCAGRQHGQLPASLEVELPASLPIRVHIAWLVIEGVVEPPTNAGLACIDALANDDGPPGVHRDECDGFAQAHAAITMSACAVDFVYRERTIQEVERERMAEEIVERVRRD